MQKAYKNMQCDCFRDLAGFQYGSGYCPKQCCLGPKDCTECIDETDFYDELVEMGLECQLDMIWIVGKSNKKD